MTDDPPTFRLGQRVRKISGSAWHGRIVGTYKTWLTAEGYCVESEREPGSVQIYPAHALMAVDEDNVSYSRPIITGIKGRPKSNSSRPGEWLLPIEVSGCNDALTYMAFATLEEAERAYSSKSVVGCDFEL